MGVFQCSPMHHYRWHTAIFNPLVHTTFVITVQLYIKFYITVDTGFLTHASMCFNLRCAKNQYQYEFDHIHVDGWVRVVKHM